MAAQARNEDGLRGIEAAWKRMVDNIDDVDRFVAADRDFHFAVLRAAGNEYLAAIGTAISAALTVSLHRTNPTPQSNRASLPSHERILVALRDRDGEAAANESRRQLAEAMQRLRSDVGK